MIVINPFYYPIVMSCKKCGIKTSVTRFFNFGRPWLQFLFQMQPKYWTTFGGYFEKYHLIKTVLGQFLEELGYSLFQHLVTLTATT